MNAPFGGLFGKSNELKVIQFLLPLRSLEFNISEMARGTGVTRQTLEPVIKKLAKWHVLKTTSKHGNANYYALDGESGFIEVFENLNNRIIEQMLEEEELAQIANYSLERCIQIQPIEAIPQGSPKGWSSAAGSAAGGLGEEWSRISIERHETYVTT
jgi:hypothetical protein